MSLSPATGELNDEFAAIDHSCSTAGHLLTSLLSFNRGVEVGQLIVLITLVPLLGLIFRHVFAERIGVIILSVLIGHTGWHWMLERGERLSQFPWPVFDAVMLASAMRWLMALLVLAGAMWAVNAALQNRAARNDTREDNL